MAASEPAEILRFDLGDGTYCIDIDHVAEIVSGGQLRSLPGSAPHVEGVMELRGETTTIVNPRELLDSGDSAGEGSAGEGSASNGSSGSTSADPATDDGSEDRIIVLDSDVVDRETATGWRVSGVSEVTAVSTGDLETGPVADSDLLRGLIKEGEEFVFWVDPRKLCP